MEDFKETAEQYKKQYDWLKPHQFKKGQSGNPEGRKKGSKSLKVWLREHFESLDDEGKKEFFKHINPELAWRMGEGNPDNKSETKLEGSISLVDVHKNIETKNE